MTCSSNECIWDVNSTTSIESLNTKRGDQFDPESPGHFDPGMGGHFKSESGGQFQRNLHLTLLNVIVEQSGFLRIALHSASFLVP